MSLRDLFSNLAGIQETVLLSPANVAGPAPSACHRHRPTQRLFNLDALVSHR